MTRTCCYMLQKYIEVAVLITTHCFIVTAKKSHSERQLLPKASVCIFFTRTVQGFSQS